MYELLYGLMLPSGNDAAWCLAENFGYIIKNYKKSKTSLIDDIRKNNILLNFKKRKVNNEVIIDSTDISD